MVTFQREGTVLAGEERMLIDGELLPTSSGRSFAVIDPSTGERVGSATDGTVEDTRRAVAAARRAYDTTEWSRDSEFRYHCIKQLESALTDEKERLRRIEITEVGAPISATAAHIEGPIAEVAYWAELGRSFDYLVDTGMRDIGGRSVRHLVQYSATGVVGAITPWNVPFYLNITETIAPLMAGNAVVLKPAQLTPWAGAELGRIVAEKTDVPPGIFNVVLSNANEVGAALAADPQVDVVTFTGSTETGRRILAAAAPTVKKSILELGGKSAHIVLDDADMTACLPRAAAAAAVMSGQSCVLCSRILLPRSRYDEGIEILKSAMESITVGDPWDPATVQGPLISAQQRDKVLGLIADGVASGARLVTGGGAPSQPARGYFVQPTLLVDVDPGSVVAQQEIFGPVLTVTPYDTDEEAVAIANGTIYGLSGEVSGADDDRALRIALRLTTGTTAVNGAPFFSLGSPFGGVKQSGLGRRNGLDGFREYLQTKTIGVPG